MPVKTVKAVKAEKTGRLNMQTSEAHRCLGFTLIEMLTVISIIGLLVGMLLPALSGAREKGRQVACQSNLHQIGVAILVYAGDYQNHTPPAFETENGQEVTWYTLLTNGNYTTTKVFQCPDDRRNATTGTTPMTPRSYAMVIGYQNTAASYNNNGVGNFWIAGSRLTCPWLTNSQVAVVAEYYTSPTVANPIVPTLEDQGTISPFVTSSYGAWSQSNPTPSSRHSGSPLTGNYLFLDGHVQYVNSLVQGASYATDAQNNQIGPQMFPQPPTIQGLTGAICP